jgi:integrase
METTTERGIVPMARTADPMLQAINSRRDLLLYGEIGERGSMSYLPAAIHWVNWMDQGGVIPNEHGIREYFRHLSDTTTKTGKHLSASTQLLYRQAVKHRITLIARSLGEVALTAQVRAMFDNIEHNMKKPKRGDRLPTRDKFLTREDVGALVSAAGSERQRLLIRALWITGARVAELCSMRKDTREEVNGGWTYTVLGKGSKERRLFVPTALHERITAIFTGEEYLFTTEHGGPFNGDYVSRLVRRAGRRIGKNISAHVLRHSIITHHVKNGENIEAVRDFAGHSSISTTQVYVHSHISTERRALAAV